MMERGGDRRDGVRPSGGEDARISAVTVFFFFGGGGVLSPPSDARMVEPLLTEPSDAHQR